MDRSHAGPGFLVVLLTTVSSFLSLPTVEGQVQSTEVLKAQISELQKQISAAQNAHSDVKVLGKLWLYYFLSAREKARLNRLPVAHD